VSPATDTQHHFVFICGLHRSGTSLLARCMRRHPQVSGFRETSVPRSEGQHLQTVYPPARVSGGPGRFGFDPEAHLTETSTLITEENRRRLLMEWSRYWDLEKPVLLEKSPPNLIRTRFLQALFPSSSFLIILRHPLAVSYSTEKWTGASLSSLIDHWLVCHDAFKRDLPHLRRAYVLRYEDFVSDPAAALTTIYTFLRIETYQHEMRVREDTNEIYLAQWRRAITHGWPEGETIQARFGERVAHFGYSLNP
jgi:hypothetical protein